MLEYIAYCYIQWHGAKYVFMRCIFSFSLHLSRQTGMKWTMTLLAHLISLRHHYSTRTTTLKNVKATRCTIKKRPTNIWAGLFVSSCLHHILTILIKEFEYNKNLIYYWIKCMLSFIKWFCWHSRCSKHQYIRENGWL